MHRYVYQAKFYTSKKLRKKGENRQKKLKAEKVKLKQIYLTSAANTEETMKNAQQQLSEVDDDELWLQQQQQYQQQQHHNQQHQKQQPAFRLAHNRNKSNQPTQQQLKSLSTKYNSKNSVGALTTATLTRRRTEHIM